MRNKTKRHLTEKTIQPKAKSLPDVRPTSIVGIGASAGGLEAFEQLLRALPTDTGMGFVLVQHLAPQHESILSELLARATKMPVIEVSNRTRVRPNHVYVIPPNADMTIADGVLHLSPLNIDRSRRMPIDLFLRSLAEDQQSRAIGVILSGTASDGTLGLAAVKASGGVTFAQDEESAKYGAMPRSAIASGSVDFVLHPEFIAREMKRIARHVHVFASDDHRELQDPESLDNSMKQVFLLLRNVGRVDFSSYKIGTIRRRITRRMFLRKIDDIQTYVKYLRENREEVEALFNDVLINVTGFFRDPEIFEMLQKSAFPELTKRRDKSSAFRIWVPGCSTGEEAYSLAIVLLDYLGDSAENAQIQIFATDVSDSIVRRARAGIYPASIAMDVSPPRLRRYFQKVDGSYQVSRAIRDMCVFAKHDITRDPPFSKLDMISCRNVMIYMGQSLQKRIIPLFHYALNPGGLLFLGSSETVGGFADLFVPIDKKYKIYSKKTGMTPVALDFMPHFRMDGDSKGRSELPMRRQDLQKLTDQMLLNRYVPPSVIVNEQLDIIQFVGQTGHFLEPASGDASLNLMRMVKSGLHAELKIAFQKVKKGGSIRREGVLVDQNGSLTGVNFEVFAVQNTPETDRYYAVVFEEAQRTEAAAVKIKPKGRLGKPERKSARGKKSADESDDMRLQVELDATREYLQSIIEEQRTTNEELRSANEEIQSSNEELQSINEEMETAKEELQSTNEELTTVNEELQNRNDQMGLVNSDLNNLLSSVSIPIVMLGHDLRIRRYTPVAELVMNLIPSDVGRPITDIKSNLKISDLRRTIAHVMDTLEIQEIEIEDNNGKWYSMRIRPYRTVDNKIDGVVIVLLDLDSRIRPEK